jgi:hypothetical protein
MICFDAHSMLHRCKASSRHVVMSITRDLGNQSNSTATDVNKNSSRKNGPKSVRSALLRLRTTRTGPGNSTKSLFDPRRHAAHLTAPKTRHLGGVPLWCPIRCVVRCATGFRPDNRAVAIGRPATDSMENMNTLAKICAMRRYRPPNCLKCVRVYRPLFLRSNALILFIWTTQFSVARQARHHGALQERSPDCLEAYNSKLDIPCREKTIVCSRTLRTTC